MQRYRPQDPRDGDRTASESSFHSPAHQSRRCCRVYQTSFQPHRQRCVPYQPRIHSRLKSLTYLCHLTYPLLIIKTSPCLSVVPCHSNVSAISSIGISCLVTGLGAFPFFSSYHLSQSHSTPRPTIPPFSHQLCVPLVSVVPACSCVSPL
jgi:hypothetical protein